MLEKNIYLIMARKYTWWYNNNMYTDMNTVYESLPSDIDFDILGQNNIKT